MLGCSINIPPQLCGNVSSVWIGRTNCRLAVAVCRPSPYQPVWWPLDHRAQVKAPAPRLTNREDLRIHGPRTIAKQTRKLSQSFHLLVQDQDVLFRTNTLSRLEERTFNCFTSWFIHQSLGSLSFSIGISANVEILLVVFKNPIQIVFSQLLQKGHCYL